jgi:hypothetical protein
MRQHTPRDYVLAKFARQAACLGLLFAKWSAL